MKALLQKSNELEEDGKLQRTATLSADSRQAVLFCLIVLFAADVKHIAVCCSYIIIISGLIQRKTLAS